MKRPLAIAGLLGCLISLATTSGQAASVADAAELKDWERVVELIDGEAGISDAQPDGMTALHWAVYHDQPAITQRLLSESVDSNTATRYGVTPLSIACQNGFPQLVAMLLEAGADANAKRAGGETALMTAARTGNAAVIESLLAAGAKTEATEANGQTALMWAASAGQNAAVESLLAAGADQSVTSRQGFTALHFAARDGQAEVASTLLDAGADLQAAMHPKQKNGRAPRDQMSPLLLAVESAHFELALELVRRGADPNDQRSGYAPLHAVSWVRKANLGDNPAGDPEPRGSGSVSSLRFVRRLLDAGAEVNLQIQGNKRGQKQLKHEGGTPVLFASRTADLALVKLLVELGADPLQPNIHGCTPLMACTGVGVQSVGEEAGTEPEVLETAEFLLAHGAEVNTIDDNRETPMHGAAYRNYPRVVELLVDHGADPARWNHKNKSGWTPMQIAQGYRPGSFKPHPETLAALTRAMSTKPDRQKSTIPRK